MRKLLVAIIITASLVSCKKEEVKLSETIKMYTDLTYKGIEVEVLSDTVTQEDYDRLGKPSKEIVIILQDRGSEITIYEWTHGSKHVISDGEQVVSVEE